MRNKLVTVFLKFSSYAISLLAMVSLTYSMGGVKFGQYSIVMGVAEFLIVLVSGGQSVACMQRAINDRPIYILSELFVPFCYGSIPAVLFLFLANSLLGIDLGYLESLGLMVFVSLYSFIIINSSILAGAGFAFILNNESAMRSLFLVGLCLLCYFVPFDLQFRLILIVLIFANLAIFIVSLLSLRRLPNIYFGFNKYVIDRSSFVHVVMGFLSRKSDILIVGLFFPPLIVTVFKYSFLLCEAPIQFVAAYLNTVQRGLASGKVADIKRTAFTIASVLFFCGFLLVFSYHYFFERNLDLVLVYLAISPYFLGKSFLYYLEYRAVLVVDTGVLQYFSSIQAIGHVLLLFGIFSFVAHGIYLPFGVGYFSVLLFEIFLLHAMRKYWRLL